MIQIPLPHFDMGPGGTSLLLIPEPSTALCPISVKNLPSRDDLEQALLPGGSTMINMICRHGRMTECEACAALGKLQEAGAGQSSEGIYDPSACDVLGFKSNTLRPRYESACSPFEVSIAINYYVHGMPHVALSTALKGIQGRFVKLGLLTYEEGDFRPNMEALRLYVETLLSVPFPVREWVMPDE